MEMDMDNICYAPFKSIKYTTFETYACLYGKYNWFESGMPDL